MHPALLNRRIIIQRACVVADELGNRRDGWEDWYACFATVTGEDANRDSEVERAGQTVDDQRADFTVRWCARLDAVNTKGFRVLMGAQIYDIIAVDHMSYRHKSIKLKCGKARR